MFVITIALVALTFGASTTPPAPPPPSAPPPPPSTELVPTTILPTGSDGGSTPEGQPPVLAPGEPVATAVPFTPRESEIVAVAYASRQLAMDAYIDPYLPELERRISELYYPGGQQERFLVANIDELRTTGYRAVANHDIPWVLKVVAVEFRSDGWEHATADVCFVDTTIMVEPDAAPDGSDVILNDKIGTFRSRMTFGRHDGRWKLYWNESIGEPEIGVAAC